MKKRLPFLIFIIGISIGVCFLFSWPRPFSPKTEKRVTEVLDKYKSEFSGSTYVIVIDYSLPVFQKRLWLLDLKTKKVVLNCHVSHAWESGFFYPKKLSNTPESNLSCKGVFKTRSSYKSSFGKGENAVGMRIEGLEKSNNNALKRSIVFHSSWGMWSSGCFMTFPENNKRIIDLAKNGNPVIVF